MVKLKETTFFCIYTILSYTASASIATDKESPDSEPPSEKRPGRDLKQYFRDSQLSLSNPNPGAQTLPSLFSLHNLNAGPDWRRGQLQVYRSELVRLIVRAKEDVDTNLAYLKSIVLKSPTEAKVVLRLADLVKLVESRYKRLVQLYSRLRTNGNALLLPNLLHVYEAILRGKHEIATILGLMRKVPEWAPRPPGAGGLDDRFESSIAWSYYDDNW